MVVFLSSLVLIGSRFRSGWNHVRAIGCAPVWTVELAQDHTRVILASPETERGPGVRARSSPTLPGFPGVDAWKGTVGRPWFIIAAPRPRLRTCVFHAPLREGSPDHPEAGTAHASSTARRCCEAAPCPAKGKQERRQDIKEWNHADGTDGIAARRLRDRRGTR